MSSSDAEAFIKKLMTNPDLYQELKDRHGLDLADEPDEQTVRDEMADVVPEMAKEHGFEFTSEEGFEALDNIKDAMKSEELSDVELEQVAGGKDSGRKIGLSVGSLGIGCAVQSMHDASYNQECMG